MYIIELKLLGLTLLYLRHLKKQFFTGWDGSLLINVCSAGLLGTLIPLDPFGSNILLTISLYTFAFIATLNHLFPKSLQRSTHLVKASFTLALAVSVGMDLKFALPIVGFDLVPLILKNKRLQNFSERIGAIGRFGLLGLGFYQCSFNPYLIALYAFCNYFYYKERKERIAKSERHNYSIAHSLEHWAILAYLFTVNYSNLNIPLCLKIFTGYFGISFSLILLYGIWTNIRISREGTKHLPEWFDKNIVDFFQRKTKSNLQSWKIHNYIFKPFADPILLKKITWKDLESMINQIQVKEPVDIVAGVFSGGAFLANYVAQRIQVEKVIYIQSKYWSGTNIIEHFKKMSYYKSNRPQTTEAYPLEPNEDYTGKTILLVDDSCCSGNTLKTAESILYKMNAKKVLKYVLFCNPKNKVDYFYSQSYTPLIWPWGWEAD